MNQSLPEYINLISNLIGKSINTVKYYEQEYGEPLWENEDHHSLDYGLEFRMSNGENYFFTWGHFLIQYDLKFGKGKLNDSFIPESKHVEHIVTDNRNWEKFIGIELTNIQPILSWVETNGAKTKYLQDLILEFKNGHEIIISVSEIRGNSVFPMQDHISVFFNIIQAKKYGVGIKNEISTSIAL